MQILRKILCATVLLAAFACNRDLDLESREQLVVEGWIENGSTPVVLVSSTIPVSSEPQPIASIGDHILRHATVYIEHGGKRYDLRSVVSGKYMMKHYFTTSDLHGEVGQSYTLHVKYKDMEAVSTCTITEPCPIRSADLVKSPVDTTYFVKLDFDVDLSSPHYYKVFLRNGTEEEAPYKHVSMTQFDSSELESSNIQVDIFKPLDMSKLNLDEMGYDPEVIMEFLKDKYFHPGDSFAIKLVTMDRNMHEYWRQMSNESVFGSNMMVPAWRNATGNVDGAIGYWAGYGCETRYYHIP